MTEVPGGTPAAVSSTAGTGARSSSPDTESQDTRPPEAAPQASAAASLALPATGPSPSSEIAKDMVRRGLMVMPVVVGLTAVIGDRNDAASVAYGMVIIMANFLLSAYLLAWAARISLGLVASVALGGYVMRLALVFVAVWLIRDTSWVRMIPLGITIIATHLGLLVWELRHVSATFAHPGLKPAPPAQQRSSGSRFGRQPRPAAGYRPQRPTRTQDTRT